MTKKFFPWVGVEPNASHILGKHPNHYTTEAPVSHCPSIQGTFMHVATSAAIYCFFFEDLLKSHNFIIFVILTL